MIPRKLKIGNKERISFLLKKAPSIRSRYFFLRYMPNSEKVPRFSLVLSKKIAKTAVARNLLRRRIYEAIGRHLKGFIPSPGKTCYDVVVLCSVKAGTLSFSELEGDLRMALKKLKET